MRIRRAIGAALAGTFALASCDQGAAPADPPAAAPAAFSHALTADLSGYYLPAEPLRVGDWSLHHVFIGQAFEFEAWEAGTRNPTFAPVMIQFDDVTSPMVRTELGEAHSVTARVLPTRYRVTDSSVMFEGQAGGVGAVRFEGRLDPGALATARRNLGGDAAVLTGTLTVAGRSIPDVRLRWWMGD